MQYNATTARKNRFSIFKFMLVTTISTILAALTILGQVLIVVGLIYYIALRTKLKNYILDFLNSKGCKEQAPPSQK